MANIIKPQSKPINLDKNLPVDAQIRELERYLIIMWKNIVEAQDKLADLDDAVDTEYPTDRILNLLRRNNGHTSSMPDKSGDNKDHDSRYYSKDEASTAFRRQVPLLLSDGRRIVDSKNRTILIDSHKT